MSDSITRNEMNIKKEQDDFLKFILKDVEKPKEEEKEEEEYDYESYSDEEDDMMIIMNQNETTDAPEENRPKIDESQDGLITIPNEERYSAFDLDINMLKLRKWRIIGDESDYFNYGLNESMWKEYRDYVIGRFGKVNIDRLRKYSESLIAQATYLPFSSSVVHSASSYNRHSSTNLFDINSLKPYLNSLNEEQIQMLKEHPDKLQQFVKENFPIHEDSTNIPHSPERHHSRSRSRHGYSQSRPSRSHTNHSDSRSRDYRDRSRHREEHSRHYHDSSRHRDDSSRHRDESSRREDSHHHRSSHEKRYSSSRKDYDSKRHHH